MEPIDPTVKNLVSAIGRAETGDNKERGYTMKGKSGEFGRYQFMPKVWKEWAKESLGNENAPMSVENQNRVAYHKVKQWKDQGLTPAQIASKWNSGGENKYKENWKGVNSQGVAYDTPAYALKVSQYYNELKSQAPQQQNSGFNPRPYSNPDNKPVSHPGQFNLTGTTSPQKSSNSEEQPSLSSNEGLVDEIRRRKGELKDINSSDQNIFSKGLQHAGQVAGLATSLAERGLSAITPNFIERPIAGALQGAGKQIAENPIVQKGVEKYGQFAEKNPGAAKNIGAVGNIAGLIPATGALTAVANIEKGLIKTGMKGVTKGLIKTGLKSATDDVLELVNPKMTGKQIQSAVAAGQGTKSGLLGNVSIKPNAKIVRAAESVADVVDPKKTLIENINMTREALSREAELLKSKIILQDHPYTFKELQSRLNRLEEPISLRTDEIKTFNKVKKAAMAIAKKNGGTVSSLLDARKEFDNLISREFPTLYERENAIMKNAIRSVREEMNNFINDNLPNELGFRESLAKQSSMFDAIDGMASKASAEVGTNAITRLGDKHPVVKGLLEGGMKTTGAAGIFKATGLLP